MPRNTFEGKRVDGRWRGRAILGLVGRETMAWITRGEQGRCYRGFEQYPPSCPPLPPWVGCGHGRLRPSPSAHRCTATLLPFFFPRQTRRTPQLPHGRCTAPCVWCRGLYVVLARASFVLKQTHRIWQVVRVGAGSLSLVHRTPSLSASFAPKVTYDQCLRHLRALLS